MQKYGVGHYGNGLYSAATTNSLAGEVATDVQVPPARINRDRAFAGNLDSVYSVSGSVAVTAGLVGDLAVQVEYVGGIQYALNKILAGEVFFQMGWMGRAVADFTMRGEFSLQFDYNAAAYLGRYWNPEVEPTVPWNPVDGQSDIWVTEAINKGPWGNA